MVVEVLDAAPGPTPVVTAVTGDGLAGAAVAELAMRLALGWHASLVLVPRGSRRAIRRATTIVARAPAGLTVSTADRPPAASFIVAGPANRNTAHAVVHHPPDHPVDCVEHLLELLADAPPGRDRPAPAPSTTPTPSTPV